jgi:predicted nucleic acid-binding Zn ribbon protein
VPECSGKLEKLVSRAAFQLKGGGWYSEGYGKSGSSSSSSSSSSESSEKSSSDSGEKKKAAAGGCGSGSCGCH